ncbi:hypothetical protein IG631_02778 [Alternaria alternata]|nr:hypothetical protein IG631_02778 [Alternaria alternata]
MSVGSLGIGGSGGAAVSQVVRCNGAPELSYHVMCHLARAVTMLLD